MEDEEPVGVAVGVVKVEASALPRTDRRTLLRVERAAFPVVVQARAQAGEALPEPGERCQQQRLGPAVRPPSASGSP
jgi:hypothetical protein